jgi:hypothetical protein
VQVAGTTRGTVTGLDGRFELEVRHFPARLEVRHVGYRSAAVELGRMPDAPLDIGLDPEIIGLEELVVTDESVAEGIMHRAIERRQAWRDSAKTAYAEAYSRYILMREFEPVRVEETLSAVWWKKGHGTREVVRARRSRPRRDERLRLAGPLPVPDLSDETIELYGTRFVGPLHPESPSVYRFTLFGRHLEDGRAVFDVAFVPARTGAAAFTGYLSVEDSTFDVLSVTASPAVDRVGPPPILERVVRMEQSFARVDGGTRPAGFRAEGHVRFGMPGATYPTARFRQVVGLAGHAIRVPAPDSLFESERLLRDTPDVRFSDWLFDGSHALVAPSAEDTMALERVIGAPPLARAFRPRGLLRSFLALDLVEATGPAGFGVERRVRWKRPWAWFNRVDGWQVGLQPFIPVGETWSVTPRLGYAEARGGVPWGIELARDVSEGFLAGLGADQYSAVVGDDVRYSRFLLGLAAYGGWTDHHDYYARRRAYARAGWTSSPGRASLTLSVERHRSEPRHDFHDGLLVRNEQRANLPIQEGRLVGLTLNLSTGDALLPGYHWAAYAGSVILVARRGMLGSDFGFVRWSGAASIRFPTFDVRRQRPASLRLDLYFGLASDGTPVQLEGSLQHPVGPLAPGAGFWVSDARLPLVRHWIAAFWEHDFGSLVGELAGFAESSVALGVFGGHAVSADDENSGHHEVGLFVSNVLGYPVRLNVGSSVERFRLGLTVSVSQSF